MRIQYISCLPETMSGGPKYSVPAQISHQSRLDAVSWINMSDVRIECGSITPKIIRDKNAVVDETLAFKPDLVVFEDLYYLPFVFISKRLVKEGVPYIIVPRGSMTALAQRKKHFKKAAANFLLFDGFIERACAIEYLADKERDLTYHSWKGKRALVIPNGTSIPKKEKESDGHFKNHVGVFIGRIDFFSKGIDVFLDACSEIAETIRKKGYTFVFYGPYDGKGKKLFEKKTIESGLEKNILLKSEIHGEKKQKILSEASFFILTSRFEGLPMGLLEALSYGLPCVVTYETNMGEEIERSGAGFCSSCNVEGVKLSLQKILGLTPSEVKKMREKASCLAKQFDWDNIAKKTHEEYERLIREKQ